MARFCEISTGCPTYIPPAGVAFVRSDDRSIGTEIGLLTGRSLYVTETFDAVVTALEREMVVLEILRPTPSQLKVLAP